MKQSNHKTITGAERRRFNWKHYFAMLAAFVGLIVAAFLGMAYYSNYAERQAALEKAEQSVQETLELWDARYVDDPDRFDSDIAGADTPQGTLLLFADALEDDDVARASEYVMQAHRRDARRILAQVGSAELEELAQYVRNTVGEEGLMLGGGRVFILPEPVYVEFLRYPAGNWKIFSLEGEVVAIPSED